MSKKSLFIVFGIVLLISAALAYVLFIPSRGNVADQMTYLTTQEPKANTSAKPATTEPGVYSDYSEEAVKTTTGTKLLFFHAPWCPQCRSIEASIEEDGIPSSVTVFKIDYDSNQKLRQQYGVTIQTTFVKVDDAGNKIASYVAYEEPQFSSVERELLK